MALSQTELKALLLPDSLFKKEIYNTTPGYRIRHDGYNFFDLVSQVVDIQTGGGLHAALADNFNGTYTYTSPIGATILIDTRAASNPTSTLGLIPPANTTVQLDLEWLHQYVINAQALFGTPWTVGPVNPNLGTFTGWTISDNLAIKPALQELELAIQDSLHLADNGLTKVTGTGIGLAQSKVQLGGTLIQDTDILTAGFRFRVTDSASRLAIRQDMLPAYTYGGTDEAAYFEGAAGDEKAISGIKVNANKYNPFMFRENAAVNTSRLIELKDSDIFIESKDTATHMTTTRWFANGIRNEVHYGVGLVNQAYTEVRNNTFRIGSANPIPPLTTPFYDLPTIDGTVNQYLKTNGLGTLSWTSGAQEIHFQEFLTAEPIVDRVGDSFFVVPNSYNGLTTSSFKWSVFTPNTGTFTIKMEINGASVAGLAVNVIASAQNGDVTFPVITLNSNDRIRFSIQNSTGATPSGLALVLLLN